MTPYPDPTRKILISTDGGEELVWARDGREIFYRTDDAMMVVPFDPDTGEAEAPSLLFEDAYVRDGSVGSISANYDVSVDGQSFIMVEIVEATESGSQPAINVVLNWFEELERLVPTH